MKLVSITQVDDRVVVAPSDTTSQGWHVESGEYLEVAVGPSIETVADLVVRAFDHVRVGIPTPSRDRLRGLKLLESFGVNTYRKLAKLEPVHVSVLILDDESVVVTPYTAVSDGFDPIGEKKIRLESMDDGLVDALSELLPQTR